MEAGIGEGCGRIEAFSAIPSFAAEYFPYLGPRVVERKMCKRFSVLTRLALPYTVLNYRDLSLSLETAEDT